MPHLGFAASSPAPRSRFPTRHGRAWSVDPSQMTLARALAVRIRARARALDVRFEKAFGSDVTQRVLTGFTSSGIRPPSVLHRGG